MDIPPFQFLYSRKGPWPQPAPAHPLLMAPEVLNIPPDEQMAWNLTIGMRYAQTLAAYPPAAAAYAAANLDYAGPSDEDFNRILFDTCLTRLLRPYNPTTDIAQGTDPQLPQSAVEMYDFRAMSLIEPIAGTYCAPTRVAIGSDNGKRRALAIQVGQILVKPSDPAWQAAKLFVLQGASYHLLFVVHPALHFPLDSINAITKSSVPLTHPLYQAFAPHSSYQLALDNAVLESPNSVVNEDAQACWFDPLTSGAYNLKLLFGAGYTGLQQWPDSYPQYDYMRIDQQVDSAYGSALGAYAAAFVDFGTRIAEQILIRDPQDTFVKRWARYNHEHVLGFPDDVQILDKECLGRAMGLYMFDASVSHGADHFSFANQVPVRDKFTRLRIPPPQSPNDPLPPRVLDGDDLFRAAITQELFFAPSAVPPTLAQIAYAFVDPVLQNAQRDFINNLRGVDELLMKQTFQPLIPRPVPGISIDEKDMYLQTIPASIQY